MNIKVFIKKCITHVSTWYNQNSRIIHFFNVIFSSKNSRLTDGDFEKLKHSTATNLVIVTHPDDETIFCGNYILQNNCFVVCLTNRDNTIRYSDFTNVMNLTNCDSIILDYPDLTNNLIDNWNKIEKSLLNDINQILTSKPWANIITHNPHGEYGHIHHKKTSKFVKRSCKKLQNLDKLKFFYYDYVNPIENFNRKLEMLNIYKIHQPSAINFLLNVSKYETLVDYKNYNKRKII